MWSSETLRLLGVAGSTALWGRAAKAATFACALCRPPSAGADSYGFGQVAVNFKTAAVTRDELLREVWGHEALPRRGQWTST